MKPTWREFISSPHHAILALATLGVGFLTAEPLYFIFGLATYVVGWVFMPGTLVFQRYLKNKSDAAQVAVESGELPRSTNSATPLSTVSHQPGATGISLSRKSAGTLASVRRRTIRACGKSRS